MSHGRNAEPTTVIVLGMHRSGTSCLAGCLEEAGLYLGAVNTKAPHNTKGNRENLAIMSLHDAVLAASGGSWNMPPEVVVWSEEHRARQAEVIGTYPGDGVWGFKDPRTVLTLDGWLEVLPRVRCVGTFRHPAAVARSLAARKRISAKDAFSLWLQYNRRLLDYQRRLDFDLIGFDWPVERYCQQLANMCAGLHLATPTQGASFFDSALRRQEGADWEDLPPDCEATYRALEEVASRNEL